VLVRSLIFRRFGVAAPQAGSTIKPRQMMHVGERRARWLTWLVLGVWVVALFAAFRPGLMSVDSVVQYRQGVEGSFENWHPPFMSYLLGLSDRLAGSPWPYFLLQVLLLGLGLAKLFEPHRLRWPALGLALYLTSLLLPPVWATVVTIWKDVGMAVALLWAVVFLHQGRRWSTVAALGVAVLLRHNAILAVLPMLVPLTAGAGSVWRRTWLAGALSMLLAVLPGGFERVVGSKNSHPAVQLWAHDLAGIYTRQPGLFAASMLASETSLDDLRRMYNPKSVVVLLWGSPHLDLATLQARSPELRREWMRTILRAPASYASHRWAMFRAVLAIPPEGPSYQFQERIDTNPWGFVLPSPGPVQNFFVRLRSLFKETFFYRGYCWVLVSFGGLAAFLLSWPRDEGLGQVLVPWVLASGLSYAAGYALVGVCPDFRFLFWTVLAALAAIGLSCPRNTLPGSESPRPP
jgi:hypothetical protein